MVRKEVFGSKKGGQLKKVLQFLGGAPGEEAK